MTPTHSRNFFQNTISERASPGAVLNFKPIRMIVHNLKRAFYGGRRKTVPSAPTCYFNSNLNLFVFFTLK